MIINQISHERRSWAYLHKNVCTIPRGSASQTNCKEESTTMLDKELCNRISQSASLIIGHHVLVTDKNGIVLGSNDPARIGTLHGASLDVIASGQQIYHNQTDASRLSGTKPGTTIPLSVNGEVIGTIGITGSPEEISKYAILIQQLAQLFMDFHAQQQSSVHRDYKKRNLLHDLAADIQDDMLENIHNSAYELGYDLELPRAVLWIELEPADGSARAGPAPLQAKLLAFLAEQFVHPQDFLCAQSDSEAAVLALLPENSSSLEGLRQKSGAVLDRFGPECRVLHLGIGSQAEGIRALHTSYEDAHLAARVLQMRRTAHGCLTVNDIFLEKLALNLSPSACDHISSALLRPIQQSKDHELLMQLISCWCQTRFNFSKTAEALHVHKSTLVYRFRRIEELYGLDLYDFDKTMALYLLNLRRSLLELIG